MEARVADKATVEVTVEAEKVEGKVVAVRAVETAAEATAEATVAGATMAEAKVAGMVAAAMEEARAVMGVEARGVGLGAELQVVHHTLNWSIRTGYCYCSPCRSIG